MLKAAHLHVDAHFVHTNNSSTFPARQTSKSSSKSVKHDTNVHFSFYNVGSCQKVPMFSPGPAPISNTYGCKPSKWQAMGLTVNGQRQTINKVSACSCY